jgi:RNA-binding protein
MLSSKERATLASAAQKARSLASLGKAGMTEAFVARVDALLGQHELVKLRLAAGEGAEGREEKRALAAALAERTKSELVTVIGNVAVLFRRNPDPDRRKVLLGE